MADIIQLKEDGVAKYMKTHAKAIDGVEGVLVKATGNETVLGTKNFSDGIQIKGKSLDDRMLKSAITKTIGTENANITSGSISLYRLGENVMFSCSFSLAKVWYKATTLLELGADYEPAITVRMNLSGDRQIYVEDGKLKANSDFQPGDWITVSLSWIAKNV